MSDPIHEPQQVTTVSPYARVRYFRDVSPPSEDPDAKIRNNVENYWTLRNKLLGVSIFLSSLSLVLGLIAVNISAGSQRDLKAIDLRQVLQKRYEELAFSEKDRLSSKIEDGDLARRSAMSYYGRFWDLQLEQYQYWKGGLIDTEVYASWMDFRRKEWTKNEEVQGMTYQQGWEYMKKYFLSDKSEKRKVYYEKFTSFMDGVFADRTSLYENGP